MNIDKYLYEIIDDYKHSGSDEEKGDIFKSFCSSIWSSENKRRVYTKTIRFSVRKDLLQTDVGQVFDVWSEVEYIGYKAMTKETDWCSLIRQKVNNLYTRYFDKEGKEITLNQGKTWVCIIQDTYVDKITLFASEEEFNAAE